ncbi:flagellar hook-length control protein FliK [Rheinheimera sp.]|uniref:flagellar hook-length control protein FliK n=1 Tax=Rheinheimera sp. TaxID=1869214 RepID=UPI003D280A21
MNLSINLTLGSPVTDSASSPAVIAEDMSDQGFSLRLADELNDRDLAPLMLPEDGKATDPALLEQIAARQQIAADAETWTDKDGRVWQEDPLVGLPAADSTEGEAVDTFASDKPWLDIIEKAHSYSPVVQVNKTDSRTAVELTDAESPVVAIDLEQELPESGIAKPTAEQSSLSEHVSAKLSSLSDALTTESKTAAATGQMTATGSIEAGLTPDKPESQSAEAAASVVAAAHDPAAEAKSADLSAKGQLLQSAADESATKQPTAVATVPAPLTAAPGPTDPKVATRSPTDAGGSAPLSAANSTANGLQTIAKTDEPSAQQPEIAAGSGIEKSAADHSDKQAAKTAAGSALSAVDHVAAQQETDRLVAGQQSVAATAMQAATVTTSRPTSTQNTGTEKAPAANAFAVHLRTVNQNQQQQQPQSGTEQQSGQGQAKANIEGMALNLSGPVVSNAPAFAQQLQQITETTQVAGPVSPANTHTAVTATGNSTLLSARPAETAGWQPPLVLTDPTAAQQIKDRVMVQIQHKLQTAEVQLHPEELGSMQIKLNLQQDQLSVQFVVQQGVAKEALEQQMPKLRELLEQQGIALSEGQVEQRQSRSQQEQHSARHGNHAGAESELAAVQTVQMKVSDRMVDFYA